MVPPREHCKGQQQQGWSDMKAGSPYRDDDAARDNGDLFGLEHSGSSVLSLSTEKQKGFDKASHETESRQQDTNKKVELRRAARQFIQHQAGLSLLSQDVDVARDGANYEWECRRHQYRFARDAMTKFLDAAKTTLTQVASGPPIRILEQLFEQAQKDIGAVEEHIATSKTVEEDLSLKQYRLRRKEAKLASAAKDILRSLDGYTSPSSQAASEANSTSASTDDSVKPSAHPLLESYLACLSELRNLHEQLDECQAEYEEELVGRELRLDQEQSLDQTEEDFKASYSKRLNEISLSIAEATKALSKWESECLQEGLLTKEAVGLPHGAALNAEAPTEQVEEPDAVQIAESPSSLAVGIPIISPQTLALLWLNETGAGTQLHDQSMRDSPVDASLQTSLNPRAQAGVRVSEWLERHEAAAMPTRQWILAEDDDDDYDSQHASMRPGSPAWSWPMTTARRVKKGSDQRSRPHALASGTLDPKRNASAPPLHRHADPALLERTLDSIPGRRFQSEEESRAMDHDGKNQPIQIPEASDLQ
ncbi:hypothetical protein KC318_g6039 [Hortaea werneckii]|nr:hypothetical protein KC334_g1352 [Hortaea werneckii]KAI7024651.1 hypothetical protein KC355_g1348 [Hortaea werneckii]KAI7667190.1 hypothetical protein KC318_g6039 [Hortaea werneckii]